MNGNQRQQSPSKNGDELYGLAQAATVSDEAMTAFVTTSPAHAKAMHEVLRRKDKLRRCAESLDMHEEVYGDPEEVQ